ncbi:hypothetical protein [Streptomyces sp. JJ36]|uniref:hypothetical protein n=1 Tax=Streptomyces sp. JJ36 TaxID=2736645 RepID=UPI001F3F699D|nr:hypothetical protein [Streptomyces sp. JJ36]MCF6524510.1 hypothetical protein [Streptomyces sp. JJ36]
MISVGLVLPAALAPASGPARLLARPVLARLGRVSYGVFLWHMVVMLRTLRITGSEWGEAGLTGFWIMLPLTGAVSVLFGWLSHALVEDPLRRRHRGRPRGPGPSS